jgi:hypothetical protein
VACWDRFIVVIDLICGHELVLTSSYPRTPPFKLADRFTGVKIEGTLDTFDEGSTSGGQRFDLAA